MIKIKGPTKVVEYPGSKQFLGERRRILAEYDRARDQARSHSVETYHGRVAEALIRQWLSDFLPKRYGVTPGYITSQEPMSGKLPHFDVIIYDQLESPVLWIEDNPDASAAGQSRAIPVEFVKAVIEVKAALTLKSSAEAIGHLCELKKQMGGYDSPTERYKKFLPPSFFCMALFVELREADSRSQATLDNLNHRDDLRGYVGAAVLRGEGLHEDASARFSLLRGKPADLNIPKSEKWSLLGGHEFSTPVAQTDEIAFGGMLSWSVGYFGMIPLDIVAMLAGTYEPGMTSSFYGMTGFVLGG